MLPVIGRSLYDPIPCAVIRTRGRRNIFGHACSSWDCVERHVTLLCDPDSVKQNREAFWLPPLQPFFAHGCRLAGAPRH